MRDGIGTQDRAVQVQVGDGLGIAAVLAVFVGGEGTSDITVFRFFGDLQGEGLLRGIEKVLGLLRGVVEVGNLFGLGLQIPVLAKVGVQLEGAVIAVFIRVFRSIGETLTLAVGGGSREAECLCGEDSLRLNHVAGLRIERELKQLDALCILKLFVRELIQRRVEAGCGEHGVLEGQVAENDRSGVDDVVLRRAPDGAVFEITVHGLAGQRRVGFRGDSRDGAHTVGLDQDTVAVIGVVHRGCGGAAGADRFYEKTVAVEGVLADDLAAGVFYETLGNGVVLIAVLVLESLAVDLYRFGIGPLADVELRGDGIGPGGLGPAGFQAVFVIGVGDRDGVGAGLFVFGQVAVAVVGVGLACRDITGGLGGNDLAGLVVLVLGRGGRGGAAGIGGGHGDLFQPAGFAVIGVCRLGGADDLVAGVGLGGLHGLHLAGGGELLDDGLQRLDIAGGTPVDVVPGHGAGAVGGIGRVHDAGLVDTGLAGKGLRAGDLAVTAVEIESGVIGLLAEVIPLLLIIGASAIREDGEGLALLHNLAGQIRRYVSGGVHGVDADGLRVAVGVHVGFVDVFDDRIIGIAVFVNAIDTDRTAGGVVLDPERLPETEPCQLGDLILNGLLGDLYDPGVQEILDIAGLEDFVQVVQIAGILQTLQLLEGRELPNLIAPGEGHGVNGLQRHGENHASEQREVDKGIGGDRRDIAIQDHAGGSVLQVGPGSGVQLVKLRHLTGAADNQRFGPLVEIVGKAGGREPGGAAGGRRRAGGIGAQRGGDVLNGNTHFRKLRLDPETVRVDGAVPGNIAVPVPVVMVVIPVPLPVGPGGTGLAAQRCKAEHHAENQKHGQGNFHLFHVSTSYIYKDFMITIL